MAATETAAVPQEPYVPICAYKGPGPAVYTLKKLLGQEDHCPSKFRAPAYSIAPPYKFVYNDSPGPAYNYDAALTIYGKQERPAYSLSGRPRSKAPEVLPGPGAYDQTLPRSIPPPITFGYRLKDPPRDGPAPNAYTYKTGIGTEATTELRNPRSAVHPRRDFGSTTYAAVKLGAPGPATYGPIEARVTMKSGVRPITLKARFAAKEYNSAKESPGPGRYEAISPTQSAGRRGFYMGQKHSQYVMPLITYHDCMI